MHRRDGGRYRAIRPRRGPPGRRLGRTPARPQRVTHVRRSGAPECRGLAWRSGFSVGRLVVPLLSNKAVILLVRPMLLPGAKRWAGERGCLCLASIGVVGEFAGLGEVLGNLAEFEVQSLGCAS
jgi:hypothetical protein